jgi:hypothetical protein
MRETNKTPGMNLGMRHTAAAHQILDIAFRRLFLLGQHVFEHRIEMVIFYQSLGGRLCRAQRAPVSGKQRSNHACIDVNNMRGIARIDRSDTFHPNKFHAGLSISMSHGMHHPNHRIHYGIHPHEKSHLRFRHSRMHGSQKLCPHSVIKQSVIDSKQIGHTKKSFSAPNWLAEWATHMRQRENGLVGLNLEADRHSRQRPAKIDTILAGASVGANMTRK